MTWSVLAVDTTSGASAIAVASCVPLDVVLQVPGFAPGHGALVTQSYLLAGQREEGIALLEAGLAPEEVLSRVLDPAFDPAFERRQIAIADVAGQLAIYTGPRALPFAGHAVVRDGTRVFSVQGNLLTGPEVVESVARAALEGDGCDLAARVLAALEAGGRDGRGDSRCTPLGRSAQAATLRAAPFAIDVGLDSPDAGDDPVATLRAQFDLERVQHPCPAPTAGAGEGGGGGPADAGAGPAGVGGHGASSSQGRQVVDGGGGCHLGGGPLSSAVGAAAAPTAFAALVLVAMSVRRRSRRRR